MLIMQFTIQFFTPAWNCNGFHTCYLTFFLEYYLQCWGVGLLKLYLFGVTKDRFLKDMNRVIIIFLHWQTLVRSTSSEAGAWAGIPRQKGEMPESGIYRQITQIWWNSVTTWRWTVLAIPLGGEAFFRRWNLGGIEKICLKVSEFLYIRVKFTIFLTSFL